MPKRGGKKKNNRGKGGSGGNPAKVSVPDVKNIISPGHKEEDRLLYGEGQSAGNAAESTATAPALTGSSTETPITAVAAAAGTAKTSDLPETQTLAPDSQAPVIVDKKDEAILPVREKADTLPTAPITEPAQSVATALPSDTKPAPEESALTKDTTALTDTKVAEEATKPISSTAGSEDTALKTSAAATAGAATHKQEEDMIVSAQTTSKTDATLPDVLKSDDEKTPTHPADSLVAPHVKRPHQNPIFLTEGREQPLKKPRVDDHEAATKRLGDIYTTGKDTSISDLAVPGRFPGTPSVADTASVTDSVTAGPTSDGADNAKANPVTNGTATTKTDTIAGGNTADANIATTPVASDTLTSNKTADSANVPTASDDKAFPSGLAVAGLSPHELNNHEAQQPTATTATPSTQAATPRAQPVTAGADRNSKVATGGNDLAVSAARAALNNKSTSVPPASQEVQDTKPVAPASKPLESEEIARENLDVNGKSDGAAEENGVPEQQPQETAGQATTGATNVETKSKSSGKSSAKKGGFFAWLKRKFKGDKPEKPVNATTTQ